MHMEINLTQENSDIQILFNKEENYLILDFIYDAYIYQQLKQIPAANYNDIMEYKWVLPSSSIKELNKGLSNKIVWKTPDELANDKEQLTVIEETLEDVLSRMPKNIQTPYMNIEPYDFQKVAVSWAITAKGKRANIYGGLLGDTMGLGKTIEALAISGYLKTTGQIKNCLIICPATLKLQWGQEINRFTNEKAVVVEGDKKKRLKLIEKIKETEPFYTVINYELLKQRERPAKTEKSKADKYKKQKTPAEKGEFTDLHHFWEDKYDMVIIDEAHRMKNPDTDTSKAIRHIQPRYRLLMTGTPIEKDLHNIFQLVDYLSPNIFSNESLTFENRRKAFEDRFLVTTWNPFTKWKREKMIVGVKNVGILKRTIAPYMLRRTTDDVSDELPKMIGADVIIPTEMDADQKALLNDLKQELRNVQEMRKLVKNQEQADKVDNKMNELLLYMLEVCDHPNLLLFGNSNTAKQLVKKRLGKSKTAFPTPPKFKRTMEIIEDIMKSTDEKIVIFSKYERMTRILHDGVLQISESMAKDKKKKQKLDFQTMMYTGETDKTCKWKSQLEKNNETVGKLECNVCPFQTTCNSRTKSAWFFQNDPDTRIIIATDAGNYGVNLQSGKHLINYDLPDSFSIYDQRNGRIQRLGSTHDKVHIHNVVTQDGIDMKKFHKILEQKEIAGMVVEKTDIEEDAVIRATKSMNSELLKDILKEIK